MDRPTVSLKQAKHFAEALTKATRDRENLLKEAFAYKVQELV